MQISARFVEEFCTEEHFITFIIDGLANQQPRTKKLDLRRRAASRRAPNF